MNMKYTITSLLLFVLLTAGCNNQQDIFSAFAVK